MYEDDFELKQGIDEDIAKILLDLQEKHNIYFTKVNLEWDYAENVCGCDCTQCDVCIHPTGCVIYERIRD